MGHKTDIHELREENEALRQKASAWKVVGNFLSDPRVSGLLVTAFLGTNAGWLFADQGKVTVEQSGAAATEVARIWEAQYSECEASKDRLARMHAICVESMAAFSPSAHMLGGAVMEAAPPEE